MSEASGRSSVVFLAHEDSFRSDGIVRRKKSDLGVLKPKLCHMDACLAITLICFVLIVIAFFFGNAPQKIDGKIDIVLVASPPSSQNDVDQFKAQWRYRIFEHVEIDNDTKVAIVLLGNGGEAKIMVSLTSDRRAIEAAIEKIEPMSQTNWTEEAIAFQKIREEIFVGEPDRAKVVVVFMEKDGNRTASKEQARLLRENGVFIYAVFTRRIDQLKRDAEDIAGSATRIFIATREDVRGGRSLEEFSSIVLVLFRDLCTYCRYDDGRNSCSVHAYQSGMEPDYFLDNGATCQKNNELGDIKCTQMECEKECDRQWPWNDLPNCTVKCGTIKRHPESPAPMNMENCLAQVNCQPCTSTEKITTMTTKKFQDGSGSGMDDDANKKLTSGDLVDDDL